MNGLEAITALALHLNRNTSIKVFKHEKEADYRGEYIVVNSLPFAYGRALNDDNALNVNIHIPDTASGSVNSKRLLQVLKEIEWIIPRETETEEDALFINGSFYSIESDSNPIKDKDGTHFINLVIKLVFTDLK